MEMLFKIAPAAFFSMSLPPAFGQDAFPSRPVSEGKRCGDCRAQQHARVFAALVLRQRCPWPHTESMGSGDHAWWLQWWCSGGGD